MSKESHAKVLALQEKFGKELIVNGKDISVKENVWERYRPEEVPMEHVTAIQEYNSLFYPAMTGAFGEAAVGVMKADKSVNDLTLEVPLVGKDHFDMSIKRQHTYTNPQDADKPVTKYGQMTVSLHTHAARSNRGEMNNVRDSIAALALEQLCK